MHCYHGWECFKLFGFCCRSCQMPKRPKLSLCRCRSHCRTLNQVSGLYEGSGCWIPRTMRDRHVKDDRRLFQTGGMIGLRQSAGPPRKAIEGKIPLLRDEIQWLSKCPTSSFNLAFVFIHDPISTGILLCHRKRTIHPILDHMLCDPITLQIEASFGHKTITTAWSRQSVF